MAPFLASPRAVPALLDAVKDGLAETGLPAWARARLKRLAVMLREAAGMARLDQIEQHMTEVGDRLDDEGWAPPEAQTIEPDYYDNGDRADEVPPVPPHLIIQGQIELGSIGELVAGARRSEEREDALIALAQRGQRPVSRLAPAPQAAAAYQPPSPRRRPDILGGKIRRADQAWAEAKETVAAPSRGVRASLA